jgi:hypothetical protein
MGKDESQLEVVMTMAYSNTTILLRTFDSKNAANSERVFLLIAAGDNLLQSSIGTFAATVDFSTVLAVDFLTVDVSGVLPFDFFGFISAGTSGNSVGPFETAFFVADVFGGFVSTLSTAGVVVGVAFFDVFFFMGGGLGELGGSLTGEAIGASTEAKNTPCASAFCSAMIQ